MFSEPLGFFGLSSQLGVEDTREADISVGLSEQPFRAEDKLTVTKKELCERLWHRRPELLVEGDKKWGRFNG